MHACMIPRDTHAPPQSGACTGTIAGFHTDGAAFPIPDSHLAVLEREGRLSPQRKLSLGLELTAEEHAMVAPDLDAAKR